MSEDIGRISSAAIIQDSDKTHRDLIGGRKKKHTGEHTPQADDDSAAAVEIAELAPEISESPHLLDVRI